MYLCARVIASHYKDCIPSPNWSSSWVYGQAPVHAPLIWKLTLQSLACLPYLLANWLAARKSRLHLLLHLSLIPSFYIPCIRTHTRIRISTARVLLVGDAENVTH